jgi:hypothetical protein
MNSLLAGLSLLASGSCAGPDAESARLIRAVSAWSASGDSLFNAVDSADIVLETNEAVCSRLTEAYSKLPGEVDTPGSLYVVRVGRTHYATFDPNDMAGTSRTVMIFDSELRLQAVRFQARGQDATPVA